MPLVSEGAQINLNPVTFEQLRAEPLGHPGARLLAHRERLGGFKSVDDLDQVRRFPAGRSSPS